MHFCPTGSFGKVFVRTPLPHQPYEAFEPDIVMDEGETVNLLNFGIDGMIRHAGGHTAGSITIELDTDDALVGDLIASGILLGGIARTSHAIRPPFEQDPQRVSAELRGLVRRGVRRFHMGHGGPLEPAEVLRHAEMLEKVVRP